MNLQARKQSQFELFPATTLEIQDTQRVAGILKDLTLSAENIIVLCIIFIMSWVLLFSFGVERGKGLSRLNIIREAPPAPAVQTSKIQTPVVNKTLSVKMNTVVTPKLEQQIPEVKKEVVNVALLASQPILSDAYTIQVASFKQEENAQREAAKIKGLGYESFVLSKGTHSIVCVGKFEEKQKAQKISSELKRKYQDSVIRRL